MDVEDEGGMEELFHLEEEQRGLVSWGRAFSIKDSPSLPMDANMAEKLLNEEMEKLSFVEHEKIMFDIHGIPQADYDDPADVEERLQKMEKEINKIRRKPAYELAKYWNEAYVTDRSFRLRFLRCDRFHSQLAAQRFIRHFHVKRDLFGDGAVLGRDVLLSDLSSMDTVALESGFIQVLPARDASGRSIFSVAPMHRPDTCSVDNCVRAMWYAFNATMKDEETQRKGVVGILSNFGEHSRREPFALLRQVQRVQTGMPKKIVAFHYCYDDTALKPFVQGLRLMLARDMRIRFRLHFGDRAKMIFELQTYGIPTEHHPILPNGVLSVEWHMKWLKVCRTQEESESSRDGMILPRRFDVLFGRGKYTREHTGNLRALHLVEMHRSEYEQASKLGKTAITDRIVQMIHESLGRFLKWENEGWIEVDDAVAREKVSHSFRHLRTKSSINGHASTELSNKSAQSAVTKRMSPDELPEDDSAEPAKLAKEGIDFAGSSAASENSSLGCQNSFASLNMVG